MARPKKGTPAGDRATERWHATMERRFGGKKGLHEAMQKMGAKGGAMSTTGGFASNRELARIAGAKGGRISRRSDSDVCKKIEAKRG